LIVILLPIYVVLLFIHSRSEHFRGGILFCLNYMEEGARRRRDEFPKAVDGFAGKGKGRGHRIYGREGLRGLVDLALGQSKTSEVSETCFITALSGT
jgi:hypothetical protein